MGHVSLDACLNTALWTVRDTPLATRMNESCLT